MRRNVVIAALAPLAICAVWFWGASLAAEGKILAIVGGEKIDEKYLEQKILTLPRIVQNRYDKTALGPKVLEDIVDAKIFAHAAREIKLEERPLVQFKIKDAVEGILAAEYQAYILEKALPTEAELRKYYEDNHDRFRIPETIKVRHIALKTEKEALDVLSKLKKGADFGELAKNSSVFQTEKKDGDLGWVGRGSLLPEIEAAAFSMKDKLNTPSKVIEAAGQFHIIRVEGYKPEQIVPFEKAKEQIMPVLAMEKQKGVVEEARKTLREKLGVKIYGEGGAPAAAPAEKKGK
jgi:peptidyl-prolyl cis-trans isomerase C